VHIEEGSAEWNRVTSALDEAQRRAKFLAAHGWYGPAMAEVHSCMSGQ
jgi:hypothetical protein